VVVRRVRVVGWLGGWMDEREIVDEVQDDQQINNKNNRQVLSVNGKVVMLFVIFVIFGCLHSITITCASLSV
jgi:hypothetical protein